MPFSKTNGVILAGGRGSRLWPMTLSVSKQLLPVAGRPMIYFPLATLMLAGIREITIVTSPESKEQLETLLGNGTRFGVELSFVTQPEPLGIAHGFSLAKEKNIENSTLAILGDNFFFGPKLGASLKALLDENPSTKIFAKRVKDPRSFGVLELNADRSLHRVVEKPEYPESDLIATGMYSFKPGDLMRVGELSPSKRGELEITDLLNLINQESNVEVVELPRSTYWSDLGDAEALNQAQNFITSIETTQMTSVLIPEIIALGNNWVTRETLLEAFHGFPGRAYKKIIDMELNGLQN